MSVQFGKITFDNKVIDPKDLEQVRPVLAPYGPDGEGFVCKDNFGLIYRSFHTTNEATRERQPHVLPSGAIMMWDGRLDNREELIELLGSELSEVCPDVIIAASAYQRWGPESFRRLIGDWALSVCDPQHGSLVLAKDFIGTRHLYYTVENNQVTWCTVLDPIVLSNTRSYRLVPEYIAGWLTLFPAAQLTPYDGVHAVPPSAFVSLKAGQTLVSRYWQLDPSKQIRYRDDREYEEHFRKIFFQSVRRRLRSNAPVLAELSGGVDSSSIVCVGDSAISTGLTPNIRLDTVSHFDDSEPNWNERPYFSRIEQMRKQAGWHIDISGLKAFRFEADETKFAALPSCVGGGSSFDDQLAECLKTGGNRALLSGVGGDEFTGGVPSAIPELADLLATASLKSLAVQLKRWALNKRVPWFYLLYEALREFLPASADGNKNLQSFVWLNAEFAKNLKRSLDPFYERLRVFGALPSFQNNLRALELLRGQIACYGLSTHPVYEKRYPYLDRDLVEFLIAIPREQLVRPGQRRSLMRRALTGIVPSEILERKRKAFVIRGPLSTIPAEWPKILQVCANMRSEHFGVIDSRRFLDSVHRAGRGENVPLIPLLRTASLEAWLRNIECWRCVSPGSSSSQTITTLSKLSGKGSLYTCSS